MPDCKTIAQGGSQTGDNSNSRFFGESILFVFLGASNSVDFSGPLKSFKAIVFVLRPKLKPKRLQNQ